VRALGVALALATVLLACTDDGAGQAKRATSPVSTTASTTTNSPDSETIRVEFSCGWEARGEPAIIVRIDAENPAATIDLLVDGETIAHVTKPDPTYRARNVFFVRPPVDWYWKPSTLRITRGDGVATTRELHAMDPCPVP
jgi:hypothetical protein